METYIAKQGDRLDSIIYKHYKSLDKDIVEAVLKENRHLLKKCLLGAFDKVYLPETEVKTEQKGRALW
jgi:phage tail protein X